MLATIPQLQKIPVQSLHIASKSTFHGVLLSTWFFLGGGGSANSHVQPNQNTCVLQADQIQIHGDFAALKQNEIPNKEENTV